ncbi:MAG TPA: GerMN domain-containing protein [Asanoa sp.]
MNEDQLRRILEAEASTVEVRPDALATIRERTARRRRTRWFPALAAAGATVATAAAAAAVVTFARAPSTPEPEPLPPAASVPAETTAAGTNLPVYYLGAGERLYREYHPVPTGAGTDADKVRAAVAAMLGGRPSDPDYRTAWPAGSVRSVRLDGEVVTVDLDVPTVPDAAGLQQLVWTVTAVSGTDVQLLVRGRPPAGAAGTLRRGPALTTQAPVWLIDPQDGTASGPRIAVKLSAAGPDPVVRLEVRQGDRVVHAQTVTLTEGSAQRGEGALTLPPLPAGEYVVSAVDTSVAGGADYPDDHRVTVR